MEGEQEDGKQLEYVGPFVAQKSSTDGGKQKSKSNDPKFNEVNALMSKYDKAEERVRW